MNLFVLFLTLLLHLSPVHAGIFSRMFGESPKESPLRITTTESHQSAPKPAVNANPRRLNPLPEIPKPKPLIPDYKEKNVKPAPKLPVAAEELVLGKIHDPNKPRGMVEEPGVKVQGNAGVVLPEGKPY